MNWDEPLYKVENQVPFPFYYYCSRCDVKWWDRKVESLCWSCDTVFKTRTREKLKGQP